MSWSWLKERTVLSMALLLLAVCFVLGAVHGGDISYTPGNMNLIISAPHGGYSEPSDIPDREAGCYDTATCQCTYSPDCGRQNEDQCDVSTMRDAYTKEIAEGVAKALQKLTGRRPYLIINNLHRVKLDANRDKDEAAQGDPRAERAWTQYHQYIQSAKNSIRGRGLFIDIHGQTHSHGLVELGYRLSKRELNRGTFNYIKSTIAGLIYSRGRCRTTYCAKRFISGSSSLGACLQNQGVPTLPSPRYRTPGSKSYFKGGYNVDRHGSKNQYSAKIDAIQIEASTKWRRNGGYKRFIPRLARALKAFLQMNGYQTFYG